MFAVTKKEYRGEISNLKTASPPSDQPYLVMIEASPVSGPSPITFVQAVLPAWLLTDKFHMGVMPDCSDRKALLDRHKPSMMMRAKCIKQILGKGFELSCSGIRLVLHTQAGLELLQDYLILFWNVQ